MPEPSLRNRALRCLARREHSRAELAKKLAPHGSPEEIEAVLDSMVALSLQSDTRMAASWVRSHAARFGYARIKHALALKGLSAEIIEDALKSDEITSEQERARAVSLAKFAQPPADARDWARQARFLASRGFAGDTIRAVLRADARAELRDSARNEHTDTEHEQGDF